MNDELEWHYTDATGQQVGPVSGNLLQELSDSGQITAVTQVWTEGMDDWVSASHIEGLEFPVPVIPGHQPQINLGSSSGIHLESTIQARPMGQSLSSKSKGPGKAIFFGLLAIGTIVAGIYFVTLPPESEEVPTETPGINAYQKANERVSASNVNTVISNGNEAQVIGKKFLSGMKEAPAEESAGESAKADEGKAEEKPAHVQLNAKLDLSLLCHANTTDPAKTVVLLVKVPQIHELDTEAKQALYDRSWINAKLSLANTRYSDTATTLVLAIRGMTSFEHILIGHPLLTQSPDKAPKEGLLKTHKGQNPEEILSPYFASPE